MLTPPPPPPASASPGFGPTLINGPTIIKTKTGGSKPEDCFADTQIHRYADAQIHRENTKSQTFRIYTAL